MTPEGRVKEKIKRKLKAVGAYYHMPVQNGMGAPSLDFIGCHRGRYFGIEAKAPGKLPTERQKLTMLQIVDAGGAVFVVSEDKHFEQLDIWFAEQIIAGNIQTL